MKSGNGSARALSELQQRLAALVNDDSALDEGALRDLLARRAAQLAQGAADGRAAAASIKVVIFRVADEQYAVDIKTIGEIVPLRGLTQVPGVPPFVLGVISQRGNMLSVLDVANFLHGTPPRRERPLAIIFEHGPLSVGLAVDDILDIRTYPVDAVQAAPLQQGERQRRFFEGILEGQIVLLKIVDLISTEEVIVDQE